MYAQWKGFQQGNWVKEIDVRDFIQKNYTPYEGGADFLCGPTQRTKQLYQNLKGLFEAERARGISTSQPCLPLRIMRPGIWIKKKS